MKKLTYFTLTILISSLSFCTNNQNNTLAANQPAQDKVDESSIETSSLIAYIRKGEEIRLIDSTGNGDRLLWTHPDAKEPLGLFDLAWRPDGKELCFSSAHESASSLYHADLFGIRPDGSGFRKITNSPVREDFKKYKQGTVSVTVRNNQYSFDPAQSSYGVFVLNIVGASEPQQITLPPGASKTVTFKQVADLGEVAQAIVAIYGNYRWYMPGTDVVAGKAIKAPDMIISGDGYPYFGAFRPIWKNDGSVITYRDGLCEVKSIPANPPVGEFYYKPLFNKDHPLGSCVWDLGPAPTLENKIIYSENESEEGSGFYMMTLGNNHDPSTRLCLFSESSYQIAHDVKWLPDGTGFLYSATNLMADASNIYYYDMTTKQTKQLTNLSGQFARRFDVSPSGNWIVYERCQSPEDYETVDLWIISTDGTNEKLLVKNGLAPSW